MTGSFKMETASTDINARLQHGKFRSIVTVSKDDKFADFNCADYDNDDAACIQAALDYISNLGGGHLHITGGHYQCNSQLEYTNSNLVLTGDGENTILDFTGASSGLWCIYIHGEITTTNSLLTVDANVSDLSITVENGTLFSVDDWIRIRSESIFNQGSQHFGEIQQIKSVSGYELTLNETLLSGYLMSDAAAVDKITMVEHIRISSLKITAANANNNFGIVCAQAHDVKIKNITTNDFADRAIYLIDIVSANVTRCNIKRSNRAGLGYGISPVNSCREITASDNSFYDCRHAVSCGGNNTYGIQYNQTYVGNVMSYDVQGQGMFGQHNTYDGMIVDGNTVSSADLGYFSGIHTTVSNNNVLNAYLPGGGIRLAENATHAIISNNTIKTIGIPGIAFSSGAGQCISDVHVIGNTIESTGRGIYNENTIKNVKIDNNIINCSSAYGIYIRNNGSSQDLTYIEIDTNYINSTAFSGIRIEPYTYNINNVRITNNTILSTAASIQIWSMLSSGRCADVDILTNKCEGGIYGITIQDADNFEIDKNKIKNTTYGIYIKSGGEGCSNYRATNNNLSTCTTPFTDQVNSSTKIYGNIGYPTENTGTATLLQNTTSITVTHGLAATPTNVSATPKGNVGSCWVDTYTATTFIIHCSTAPAADVDVNWTAIV